MAKPPLRVVCAVIQGTDGRVLIARRLSHQSLGGLWEFPGGKLEPGESEHEALVRELEEEVGIRPLTAHHWMDVRHHYPEREVVLHVWRVSTWQGEPYGRLGQSLDWIVPAALKARDFPAANRPIVNALVLPSRCLITGEAASEAEFLTRLERALGRGSGMVVLRGEQALALASHAISLIRAAGALAILHADPETALNLGADGVHLNRHRLMALTVRPEGLGWVGASCHDELELAQASRLELDYAFLSPVLPTASHPGAETLGWTRFAVLKAAYALPVYALGGVGEAELPTALACGAQGVAGIRAWW
ncbi:MAG: Nudix family hydrolase [Gammaproteobacteria bacterium]|nr:Nudix family hydrolase [Gammaproteobacteria bacterium]